MASPQKMLWLTLCSLILGLFSGCAEQAEPRTTASNIPMASLRLSDVLSGTDDTGFLRAEAVQPFSFPRDHGKHPGYRSEWWYFTGTLADEAGQLYGMQFTIFRQAMVPQAVGTSLWQSGQAYLAHFALTDVAKRQHYADQRFARQHPQHADVRLQPHFAAQVADWTLTGSTVGDGEENLLLLQAQGTDQRRADERISVPPEFGVDLTIDFSGVPVPQGDAGLSAKGPGQASYYFSMPRMRTSGWLRLGERRIAVKGTAWMDREWSSSVLADGVVGWDWMALRLDDGRDIMAFRLRREDGQRDPYDHGLVVYDGKSSVLKPESFSLLPQRFWQDAQGVSWPIGWTLQLPGAEQLTVTAMVDDQLMELGLTYWEGIVAVENEGGTRLGDGYLELTGYRTAGPTSGSSSKEASN